MRASPSPRALPVMVRLRLLVAHRPEPWGAEGRPQLAARSGCLPAAAVAIRGSLVPCLGFAARTQRTQFSHSWSFLGPLSLQIAP